ncbi:DUF6709 family protein [Konateibacter massiliensis]|uniref:DUF6709 family protein n=1 Tax=Konateibacter massiliensis TaxID=2002841 RepID=UPI000C159292|nr:DUF6709 family protein [Konateibacter massiliensis]
MKKQMMTQTIRRIYIAKLVPALLFLILIGFLLYTYPFREVLFPKQLDTINSILDEHGNGQEFLTMTVPDLYYTGYDSEEKFLKKGSYYYCFIDDKCVFFLLNKKGKTPLPAELHDVTIKAKLIPNSAEQDFLLERFALDLKWTKTDLSSVSADFIVSEPDAFVLQTYLLLVLLVAFGIYALGSLLLSLLCLILPFLSPVCRPLGRGAKAKQMLSEADLELDAYREFSISTMQITRNYFFEFHTYEAKVVPIEKIVWIYKHSTLSKFWGISYTLVFHTKRGKVKFKHKEKFEADAVLEYLSQKNPSILVGYSKANAKLAKAR